MYLVTDVVEWDWDWEFFVSFVVSWMFAEVVLIGANMELGWVEYVDGFVGGGSLALSVVYRGSHFVLSLAFLFVAFDPQSMLFQYVVLLALVDAGPVVSGLTERWLDLDEDEDVSDDTEDEV